MASRTAGECAMASGTSGAMECGSREADGEDRAPCRDVGPQPKAHELPAAVVFDPHEQPGGPKEPAPHLQVPAVVFAAAEHAAALRLEGGCDGIEPLVRSLPALVPRGGRHGPERCWS